MDYNEHEDIETKISIVATETDHHDDKRYRQLAYQLFGKPTTNSNVQIQSSYKGPFVDLSGKLVGLEVVPEMAQEDGKDPNFTVRHHKERKRNMTGPLGRCLICYSIVGRKDREDLLEIRSRADPELSAKTKEKAKDLMNFLEILSSAVPILSLKARQGHLSTRVRFEMAVKRLLARPWCLCGTCNAACKQFLSKHRAILELQKQIKDLQIKFLNAIKLSKALSEKDPQLRRADNDQSDDDENEDSSKSEDKRTKISLRMKTVDMVRRCLTGGKWAWLETRKSLLDHVDWSSEIQRNPEPLTLLKMQMAQIQNAPAKVQCHCKGNDVKSNKTQRKPCGPRSRKNKSATFNTTIGEKSFTKNSPVSSDNSTKDATLNTVTETLPTAPTECTVKQRRRPGPRSKTINIEGAGSASFNLVGNDVEIKKEAEVPDSNKDSESILVSDLFSQFEPVVKNVVSQVEAVSKPSPAPSLEDLHDDCLDDGEFMDFSTTGDGEDDPADPDFLPGPEVKHNVEETSNPEIKSSSVVPEAGTSEPGPTDDHIALRRHKSREHYRKMREKYPDLTWKQIVAHLREIRPFTNPHKKGLPGVKRLPISKLKNETVVKFRLTHGQTMSEPVYRRKRREEHLKKQKVINGFPSRALAGKSGLKCNWSKIDGKLYFRGVEIKVNDNGEMQCTLCNHDRTWTNKGVASQHFNRYHIDLSEGYACEHCDRKFYYNGDYQLHLKEKHGGGYQCDECGANLSNRSALFYHKRVKHQGIKPHVCEHCGKGFATRKDKTIHVRRHTGERPVVCHVCAEAFVEKQSLKLHMRRKHPDVPQDEKPERIIKSLKSVKMNSIKGTNDSASTTPSSTEPIKTDPQP